MIHRAILGSVERMFAILTEHFAAKWPFWLNPRQVQNFVPDIASEDVGSQLDTVACLKGPQPAMCHTPCKAQLWCQHQPVAFGHVPSVTGLKCVWWPHVFQQPQPSDLLSLHQAAVGCGGDTWAWSS